MSFSVKFGRPAARFFVTCFALLAALASSAAPAAPAADKSAGGGEMIKPVTGTPSGPVSVGAAQKKLWGKQSAADQAAAVQHLKDFATNQTPRGKEGALNLHETRYFLFYSDLKDKEAANWAGLLDRMYGKLATLFDIETGSNIFRGKALIFVFSKAEDYFEYEKEVEGVDAKETRGMCCAYGDGFVHIAFFRQPDEKEFAHVLVHESVHGFLHRYRSPARVPSWANEGLAELIAGDLVPVDQWDRILPAWTKQMLGKHGGLNEDFFTREHIEGWQYPVAESFSRLMVAENRGGYVRFINGIKEGLSVEDALAKRYGVGREKILPYFLHAMGYGR